MVFPIKISSYESPNQSRSKYYEKRKQIYLKLKHIPFQYIRTETFQLQHSLKPLRQRFIVNCTTFLLTCKHPPPLPICDSPTGTDEIVGAQYVSMARRIGILVQVIVRLS